MTLLHGMGVSPGRTMGPIVRLVESIAPPPYERLRGSPEDACAQITAAAAAVRTHLTDCAASAQGVSREILELTAIMAEDPAIVKGACQLVESVGLAPAPAVWKAASDLAASLRDAGGVTAERYADVIDVRNRIVAHLTESPLPGIPHSEHPYILTARDLAPADTATLDPEFVLGIVTLEGGPTSHTAILARDLGIPAVVGVPDEFADVAEGTEIAIDGVTGEVHLDDFDPADFASTSISRLPFGGEGRLADGTRIELLANVGDPAGAVLAAEAGAEGVGLLRTEFLFFDTVREPSVADQAAAYGAVFAEFPGRKVVVRTLDSGADKPLRFLLDEDEPNPALGMRGYRLVVEHREVITNQLTAIARAAAVSSADVWVMAPMVSSVAETEEFVALASDAGLKTAGVMVEVPSAALNAGPILARAAFASIGTNDLTQYAFAADRQIAHLGKLASPWDPSILALIESTCKAGAQQDRPIGVCGEAAGTPALAVVLVGLGVSSLSMSARRLGLVSAVLESVTMDECVRLATLARGCESGPDARALVRSHLPILKDLGQ